MSPDDSPQRPEPADADAPESPPVGTPPPDYSSCGCLGGGLCAAFVVLAVLSFFSPALRGIRIKEQARTLARTLVNSCKGYYAEYGKYPVPKGVTANEVTPVRTDETLTEILLGTAPEQNTKKIQFLPDLKHVQPGGGFGVVGEGKAMMVVDPWSEPYYVLMDVDGDGKLENPNMGSTTATLYQGVLVYSAGPDKDPSTWEDNIMTWDSGKRP